MGWGLVLCESNAGVPVCARLWVMTVNALQPSAKMARQQTYSQSDLMVDPLIVLRCHRRVYR